MKSKLFTILLLFAILPLAAQRIQMDGIASLEQVYGEQVESESLLPMNDLDVEFGYILYEAEIDIEAEDALLEVENVRDYAAVYANHALQGVVTDNRKKITLPASPGKYTLRLYVENIGRITYGPEILDNSKGMFGNIYLDGEPIENWKITALNVRDCNVSNLTFANEKASDLPAFHRGMFEIDTPGDTYLDISGWGMGEVWINNQYMGSYWEEEKQQSIQVPAAVLKKGQNTIVVFEMKNNRQETMLLSDHPVFK